MTNEQIKKRADFEYRYWHDGTPQNIFRYIPEKFHAGIAYAFINSDGYQIFLKDGWTSKDGSDDCGIICEYTVSDLKDAVRTIRKCKSTMKYEAYRVLYWGLDENQKMNDSFSVWGQRETDLNWSYLGSLKTEAEAKEFALNHRKSHSANGYCPVYNGSGIGYREIDPMAR